VNHKKLWKCHDLKLTTNCRLLKTLVWPVATYGCESWTIKKEDEKRIRAFEMKRFREILRIPWTARKTTQ
jgi:hypothetical protein